MIKLYGIGISSSVAKVRYMLNYMGLDYTLIETDPTRGENKTEEFLAISPTGKIPGIDLNGVKLFESNAILRYLGNLKNSQLYPMENKARALVDAWLDYVSIHVGTMMGRVLYNRILAPMTGKKVDESSLATGLEFLEKYFPVLEQALANEPYLTGGTPSLADINLLATLDPVELVHISLEKYPHITKWRERLKAQSFYQKCYKDYTQYVQDIMAAKTP